MSPWSPFPLQIWRDEREEEGTRGSPPLLKVEDDNPLLSFLLRLPLSFFSSRLKINPLLTLNSAFLKNSMVIKVKRHEVLALALDFITMF